jgi:hypothetical protein
MKLFVVFLILGCTVAAQEYVGRVDTVGGTTYDLQLPGPAVRRALVDCDSGVAVAWTFSAAQDTGFPDFRVSHNYFSRATRSWAWIDPDFMRSGASVCSARIRAGSIDWRPGTFDLYASACLPDTAGMRPAVAGVDSGLSPGPAGYAYPVMAVGRSGRVHVAMVDAETEGRLSYARVDPWRSWSVPVRLSTSQYPSQNIAASNGSDRVCVTWTRVEGWDRRPAFYIESSDGGNTWGRIVQMSLPSAFRGDTGVSFTGHSVFPYYDAQDRLHVVATVVPLLDSVVQVTPAEIWHWSDECDSGWSRVHRAGCSIENLAAPLGPGASYAGRPSIGEDRDGHLYVAWEQFDSTNVGPGPPGYLRAGVWVASSTDEGRTWNPAMRLTPENETSHRFPCIGDRTFPGFTGDTLVVTYELDLHPGFFTNGEGEATYNPIVCQFFWNLGLPGVAEEPVARAAWSVRASVVRDVLCLPGAEPAVLVDGSGRRVMDLEPGENDVSRVGPGVYFVCGEGLRCHGAEGSSTKVVVRR